MFGLAPLLVADLITMLLAEDKVDQNWIDSVKEQFALQDTNNDSSISLTEFLTLPSIHLKEYEK